MSLAIGLGGFMDGFTRGAQLKDAKEDRDRRRVMQERQDVEYNRGIEQRNAVDAINKDAQTTFDAKVAAGTEKPDNFDRFWSGYALPKLKNTYLMNGDIENANLVQKWGESEDTRRGAKLFSGALLKAQTGDGVGALSDVIEAGKIRGYINNGYEVLGQEAIVTPDGQNAGFRISLRTPDGKEVKQDIQAADLPKLIATFGNPEAAWESQQAARAQQAKDANDLKNYEDRKKVDRQYGTGDNKQRSDAIKSLRDRHDGGLGGDEKKFDDMPRDQQEKLINEEISLVRGQPGLDGAVGEARPERKVLMDTTTGKAVPAPPQKDATTPAPPAKPEAGKAKDEKPGGLKGLAVGLMERASEGLQRERAAFAPKVGPEKPSGPTAQDIESAIAGADEAVAKGASPMQVAKGLQDLGVPEHQWPQSIQAALRDQQIGLGLNP